MAQYRHLFFDLDHTLWDFDRNSRNVLSILYQDYQLKERGIPDQKKFQTQVEKHNDKFWERFRKGQINREELRWKRFWHALLDFNVRDFQLTQNLSHRFLELLPQQEILISGAKEALDYCLAENYRLHLITNGFETTQKLKLQSSGIENYFKQIVTAQACGFLKPNRAIFDFALKSAGASVSESLMIGDALEADVLGAKNTGMDQVYFNSKAQAHIESPTYEITRLKDLMYII